MFRQNLSLMFLGTASGGGPSETRNCSSLLCDFMDDLSLWLVDCAEGTLRQFQFQPQEGFKYRANRVTKIFITHMHADHIMGIVPFLRCVLYPPEAGKKPSYTSNPPSPKVEIYGPAGLRTFVRQIMKMTLTYTADCYTVHELLTKDDPVTPCDLPPLDESAAAAESGFDHNIANPNVMHVSEVRGSDIRADKKGFWKSFVSARGRVQDIEVDAGSIQHRDPCIGFVFRETGPPGRKIVILGDTYDPSQMTPLCLNPPPTLLVHESTDAPIPESADQEGKLSKRDPEEVLQKVLLRGHSVPGMAGAFAKQVKAAHLVLNHIGSRFPAPRNPWDARATVMQEFERQATEAWGVNSKKNASSRGHGRYGHGRGQQSAVAAQDFLRINIPMQGPAMFLFPPSQSKSSGYGDGQAHRRLRARIIGQGSRITREAQGMACQEPKEMRTGVMERIEAVVAMEEVATDIPLLDLLRLVDPPRRHTLVVTANPNTLMSLIVTLVTIMGTAVIPLMGDLLTMVIELAPPLLVIAMGIMDLESVGAKPSSQDHTD
ncbi:hypothetical protein CC1G_03806 [Coprinopsis cinerea okayama7|uniref:Metallo-beta-lactamase domain-containing protein n=1 Tax=Coprinopsis cinerea (strain Okayama-7 / 130 / ATCC MYA-4618 / FGSC 9003) TaxID=240176 RepID=A8NGS8_COPC7|nr:hypothetical protein CC1G_03806 [Coprinopsis cinerea okayama7\|eukprot:XP_001833589.1 hypothetical protein CC1G_03806 [Coprinopsis cinerea okayama7\